MDSNDFFRNWIERKLHGRRWCLKKAMRATSEWKKHHGGRSSYAKVSISAEPSTIFSFSSNNVWPTEKDQIGYEPYIADGIAYTLLGGSSEALLGIKIVLEDVVVHEIDSNGNAFFQATVDAMEKILRGEDKYLDNRLLVDV